jgi:hypothetical protein
MSTPNMSKGRWVLGLLFLAACTDEPASRKALESQGFTDIRFTGYEAFACSEDDGFHTGFTAKNPQGRQVSGVVCCGLLKSCTVRW